MEIPLRGRDFTERDDKEQSRVAIVNETFARRFYPGRDAIGRRFNFDGPTNRTGKLSVWLLTQVQQPGRRSKAAFYRPLLRDYSTNATLVARLQ